MADIMDNSVENLEKMLSNIPSPREVEAHIAKDTAQSSEEENPFCIKNGAYVRVSDDAMTAWIYLNPPLKGESFYSYPLLVDFLRENHVVMGLHESNLKAIAKKHVYGREIVCARGKERVMGEDGYYDWAIDVFSKRKPLIREDGSVDYSAMSEIPTVREGDLVATYHHATACVNGYDVYGNITQATAGKEQNPLRGRGVDNSKDPDRYLATMEGKIELIQGKIDIKNTYEHSGDVDLVTQKIEFIGDIHISGNVEAGVLIRASRNVFIDGVVEAANIYAGGDIVLKRGINGDQKATISAKGDVSADYIEYCKVEAGGTVRSNSFLGAQVVAGEKVLAEGEKGIILAGTVQGVKGVVSEVIGNEQEIKTNVCAGYSEDEYQAYLEAFHRQKEFRDMLADTVDSMTAILKDVRLNPALKTEETDRELEILNNRKEELFKLLDDANTETERLSKVIESGKGAAVIANGPIYRGTTVCVEGNYYPVMENTSFMKYRNNQGTVESEVIVK